MPGSAQDILATPEGISWKPLARTDLRELSGLLAAIETVDEPSHHQSLDDLYAAFDNAAHPAADAIVCWAGETPIAFGWNRLIPDPDGGSRAWLSGGVHPGWRQQGLGKQLLGWQIQQAQAETGARLLLTYVDAHAQQPAALYTAAGFVVKQRYADLLRPLAEISAADLVVPSGFTLHPYSNEWAEAVRTAHNEAFAGKWDAKSISRQTWVESGNRPSFRGKWSWVAVPEESPQLVAGYAMNSAHTGENGELVGWTDRLGVRAGYRRQGLAAALLTRSMLSFQAANLDRAGIGVDTDSSGSALNWYQRLGYEITAEVLLYVRAGG